MPIDGRSVEAVSQQFCDKLNRLLAKTISERRLVTLRLGERVQIAFRKSGITDPAILQTKFGAMGVVHWSDLRCFGTRSKCAPPNLFISIQLRHFEE